MMDVQIEKGITALLDYYGGDKKAIARMIDKVATGFAMCLLEDELYSHDQELTNAIYWCLRLRDCFDE